MTNATPSRTQQLAAEICLQFDAQFGAFFTALDLGFNVAEDLYLDISGKRLYPGPQDAVLDDGRMGAITMASELVNARSPQFLDIRRERATRQLAAEDELGRLVGLDVPSYVRRKFGPPPGERVAGNAGPQDMRWWVVDQGLAQPLTKAQSWERVVGAYVGLVEGRCDGDVRKLQAVELDAHAHQGTMEGRIATQHFSDVNFLATMLHGSLGH